MENRKPITIDEYIAGFPGDIQKRLLRLRNAIKRIARDAAEAIKYGIPTFVLKENLVHFGGFKEHIGFYPTPSSIAAFAGELTEYNISTGSIQFPHDKPLPMNLIKRIVRFRLTEVNLKANNGHGKKR